MSRYYLLTNVSQQIDTLPASIKTDREALSFAMGVNDLASVRESDDDDAPRLLQVLDLSGEVIRTVWGLEEDEEGSEDLSLSKAMEAMGPTKLEDNL